MNELEFVLAVAQLVAKHGIPAAINILRVWETGDRFEICPQDIEALKRMVPPPATSWGTDLKSVPINNG